MLIKKSLGLITCSDPRLKRRDSECLKVDAAITEAVSSQFLGRSEHTCSTEAQQSVDSSGIPTQGLQHLLYLRQALFPTELPPTPTCIYNVIFLHTLTLSTHLIVELNGNWLPHRERFYKTQFSVLTSHSGFYKQF